MECFFLVKAEVERVKFYYLRNKEVIKEGEIIIFLIDI